MIAYLRYRLWDANDWMRDTLTRFLLRLILIMNQTKDDSLSNKLHELAGLYQRRPQDGWYPPSDWDCWSNGN